SYTMRTRSERLDDVLQRAGGVTAYGDAAAAYFSRRVAGTSQVEQLVKRSTEVRDEQTGAVTANAGDAARLDNGGSRIRVGVDVVKALRDRASRDNLLLVDGDSIHVPARQQTVTVRGAVNAPTETVATGKGLGAYIKSAGGGSTLANVRAAYVIQPNGKIESRSHILWVITLDPEPRPGATVVVPAKGEQRQGTLMQTITVITQTLTALATVVVLAR
ncbi:MAG: capsule biosynthesis GfcC family protein, partial [Gemmatimonadota bacterium]|nr:capsule biosynthesis GfcC family protein [Gemmatimonadota bacterium]